MRTRDEVLRQHGIGEKVATAYEEHLADSILRVRDQLDAAIKERDEFRTEWDRAMGYWDKCADRLRELEAQQAASEPVAWAADYISDYGTMGRLFLTDKRQAELYEKAGHTITPLYAHPSAAGVTVTEAMVEAACKVWDSPDSAWSFRRAMKQALTAALTAASEGASA